MDNSIHFKLILIGGIKSCKTIFLKYLLGIIDSNDINQYNGSIGVQYCSKSINFFDKRIIFDFWDMAGNEQYDQLIRIFLPQCKFVFVFFDSSNKTSFQRAKTVFNIAKNVLNPNEAIYVLISAKYDLYPKSKEDISDKASEEEALEFAYKNNMLFAHISLMEKYSKGINELFDKALKEYYKRKR